MQTLVALTCNPVNHAPWCCVHCFSGQGHKAHKLSDVSTVENQPAVALIKAQQNVYLCIRLTTAPDLAEERRRLK